MVLLVKGNFEDGFRATVVRDEEGYERAVNGDSRYRYWFGVNKERFEDEDEAEIRVLVGDYILERVNESRAKRGRSCVTIGDHEDVEIVEWV